MIFAAGFGTRMGDLTRDTPKPMLHIGGQPMINHTAKLLRDAGVERLFANTHYLPHVLEPHLEDLGIVALREKKILETGGGLRAARKTLDCDPVITINPDATWTGPNPVKVLSDSWHSSMAALLLLVPTEGSETGDFSLEQGKIKRRGPYRYTGLQMIRTERMDEIEDNVFSLNVYWDWLMKTGPVHGCVYEGHWEDIGTQDALERANIRATT